MAAPGKPMAKRAINPSVRTPPGPGVRGRTAVFPVSKTVHVSGQAEARVLDSDIVRQFDFPTHEKGELPQRPSTSGGPASKSTFSAPKHFNKRETRDDLHLKPLTVARGRETALYDLPPPSPIPKSATSSGSLSPNPFPLRTSSLAGSIRSRSPDSPAIEAIDMESQLGIGMALGSPSHPPPPPQAQQPAVWNQHVHFDTPRVASPEEMKATDKWPETAAVLPKQKASKWKILGGLFGGGKKTGAPSPQQFYQVQPDVGVQPSVEAESTSSLNNTAEYPKGRGRTVSERKINKHKPDMKRANTAPSNSLISEHNSQNTGTPKITLDGGPLLNIDIPSVEMERYSVMFGSVLKPSASSSSALLARRQATLDKLKTVNEALQERERELEEKERLLRPRRATSPQPTKSPAFSLFPNTPPPPLRLIPKDPSSSEPRHKSPLQRSNTAPGALSPARATFEELSAPKEESKSKHALHQAPPIAPSQHADARSKPKHQPIVTKFSQEESYLEMKSPNGSVMSFENEVYDPAPFPMKPKLYSPAWEMVTAHPTAGAGSVSSNSTLNSASSANTSISSPPDSSIAPGRQRARTVTKGTASSATNAQDVPIVFAPTPLRERTNTSTKLQPILSAAEIAAISQQPLKSSVAISQPNPNSASNNRMQNSNLPTPVKTAPKSRARAQTHIGHQKETSSALENSRLSDEQRLETAADVSIARQISVSRQQRQLLIPIKKSAGSPSPSSQGLASNPRMKVKTELAGLGERLVDSPVRALTPTLVVVGAEPTEGRMRGIRKDSGNAASGGGHLGVISSPHMHQHRRSEVGVVERA
ncbi:hypothetical protein PVAG01_08643 [Phlyctema vagabunda]|uniref:Uncharacterized protein n=1 Tax=Phlyctema vagabunda TaxID=108571 RepID=A0ABR4PA00_9HELO